MSFFKYSPSSTSQKLTITPRKKLGSPVLSRPPHRTYSLKSHLKDEAIMVKYLLIKGHKRHDRDSNPHFDNQKQQSMSPMLFTTRPWHCRKVIGLCLWWYKCGIWLTVKKCHKKGNHCCSSLPIAPAWYFTEATKAIASMSPGHCIGALRRLMWTMPW